MAGLSDITLFIRSNTDQFRKGLANAEKRLKKSGAKMEGLGKNLSQNLSLPIAAAGGAAVKAASDFEDSMVEIQKVSSATTASELRGSIRSLAEEIPVSQDKLANLTAESARFGIEGPKNIERFVKVVAKAGTATSLNMDQAGENLAKLQSVTGTSSDEVSNLGSALNSLEANAATSAQEVTDNVLKSSKGLGKLGANNKEMLGLAAAVNEVNSNAKNAGTQLNNLANSLMEPSKAEDVAKAIGMNAQEFKNMRDNDPVGMLKQLAEVQKQGGDRATKLNAALNRTANKALTSLSQNLDGVNNALKVSSREYERNKSLNEQSSKAFSTFSSKAQVTVNKLRNMAITIGKRLMPVAESILSGINSLADSFNNMSGRAQKLSILFAGVAAAVGPVLTVVGGLASRIAGPVLGALSRFSGTLLKIGPRIASLVTPAGLIKAALVGAAVIIMDNWKQFSAFLEASGIGAAIQSIAGIIKKSVYFIIGLFKRIRSAISNSLQGTSDSFEAIGRVVQGFLNYLGDNFRVVFEGLLDIVSTVINQVGYYFNALSDLFSGDFTGALNSLQKIFKSTFSAILKIVGRAFKFILDKLSGLASYLPGELGDSITEALENAKGSVDEGRKKIEKALDLQKVRDDTEKTKENIKGFFKDMVSLGKSGEVGAFTDFLGGGGGGSEEKDKKEEEDLQKFDTKGPMDGDGKVEASKAQQVKNYNKQLDKAQEKIPQLSKRQRQLANINKKTITTAGDALGKSMEKVTKGLGSSFSALIMGQKSASKAFSNFGKTVGDIFKNLIQQLIKMVVKMLAIKAITAAISGGGSLLGGGLGSSLGSIASSGLGSLLGGGPGSGMLGANNVGGSGTGGGSLEVKSRGDTMQNTLNFNGKRKNRKGSPSFGPG